MYLSENYDTLLYGMAYFIAKGIKEKHQKKWDKAVAMLAVGDTEYRIRLTDPDDNEFPNGCVLITAGLVGGEQSGDYCMIGKWMDYENDPADIAKYLLSVVNDCELDDDNLDWIDGAKLMEAE